MNISKERLDEMIAFKGTDFSDCPVLTEEQMQHFKPSHLRPQNRIKMQIQQTECASLEPELARV